MEDYTYCFSCRAEIPKIEGETHLYMLSSPGSWAMYGEVLSREYSEALYFRAHQFTVDAYACQHPGKKEWRSINSIGIHLCSLYLLLEQQAEHQQTIALRQRLSEQNRSHALFEWLEPPESTGEISAEHVWKAESPQEHCEAALRWVRSVWKAWEPHHPTVERWIQRATD
jgi:hypothetical protein